MREEEKRRRPSTDEGDEMGEEDEGENGKGEDNRG